MSIDDGGLERSWSRLSEIARVPELLPALEAGLFTMEESQSALYPWDLEAALRLGGLDGIGGASSLVTGGAAAILGEAEARTESVVVVDAVLL